VGETGPKKNSFGLGSAACDPKGGLNQIQFPRAGDRAGKHFRYLSPS